LQGTLKIIVDPDLEGHRCARGELLLPLLSQLAKDENGTHKHHDSTADRRESFDRYPVDTHRVTLQNETVLAGMSGLDRVCRPTANG
jgi:hypothetical protein